MQAALATASILLGQFHQLGVQLGRYTSLDPLEEVEKNASALPSPAWKTDSTKFSVVLKSGGRSIDKGIPTAGLLAHVMVAKFADHLPLYRQEKIFGRAGLAIARSTLAQWVGQTGVRLQPLVDALREALLSQGVIHADETPVQMLAPGERKTHRAYVWAYSTTPFSALNAVVYDFSPSRAGEHARNFLGDWSGKLVCDDFAGYKAGFEQGITEIGCAESNLRRACVRTVVQTVGSTAASLSAAGR